MGKTLYLAHPYGFSVLERDRCLPPLVQQLESLGLTVWEPFARNNQLDFSDPQWAYRVAVADKQDTLNADGVLAVLNGVPPDEGVCVEAGMAIACDKPLFLFRDDFRRCTDSSEYPLNLMLFASLGAETWRMYYYETLDELTLASKALYQWATTISNNSSDSKES
jgi:nucleoside 2-deoxyribosyltransferase